jgi:bifunctional DNase/RNase
MIEMLIDSIRVSLMNYQRVVILKEKESDRYLPIWIGPAEADAIAVKLQDVTVSRPLTHDLLRSVIDTLLYHRQRA